MYVFLGLNGRRLVVSEPEVVQVTTDVAAGALAENELAAWVRLHMQPHAG